MPYSSKFVLSLLIIAIFFGSCHKATSSPEQDGMDQLNKAEKEKLSAKYNSLEGWDSESKYTIQLQDSIVKRTIAFNAIVNDVLKKDSLYYLTLTSTEPGPECEATISIDSAMAYHIISGTKKGINEGLFILNVSKIGNVHYVDEDTYEKGNGEDKQQVPYINYHNETLLVNGKLLDYYLDKEIGSEK